jgi:hypothetical protein
MKPCFFIIGIFMVFAPVLEAQTDYEKYFEHGLLRIDYYHEGNSDTEKVLIHCFKKDPFFAGSAATLTDAFNYGKYMLEVFDSLSDKLIYSRGFCSLFEEWQLTGEADTVYKRFEECLRFPMPKNTVLIKLSGRDRKNIFRPLFQKYINPAEITFTENPFLENAFFDVYYSGPADKNVDIVIIPDGYTEKELSKLEQDAQRMVKYLINCRPFDEKSDNINIRAVYAVSEESGCDLPGEGIYKNTILSTNFYTFGSERYLTSEAYHRICDLAAVVPYEQIFIMVNHEKYGGGGIYNFYSLASSDNEHSDFLFIHEFGHAFAALGDEYYSSEVAYSDYYAKDVEPYQPNLSTLINFESKWKHMIEKDIPVPTPRSEEYAGKTGVFEGGGYTSKGVYSPAMDCTMKSVSYDNFCPVCQNAILKIIDYYSK